MGRSRPSMDALKRPMDANSIDLRSQQPNTPTQHKPPCPSPPRSRSASSFARLSTRCTAYRRGCDADYSLHRRRRLPYVPMARRVCVGSAQQQRRHRVHGITRPHHRDDIARSSARLLSGLAADRKQQPHHHFACRRRRFRMIWSPPPPHKQATTRPRRRTRTHKRQRSAALLWL